MKSKIYTLGFLIALVLHSILIRAQISWPAITNTSKPWTRWWWQGSAVDEAGLRSSMKLYQQAGLGGLEVTPIYGVQGEESRFINYLSPQWMDRLVFTLGEAKKLGLGIDMATGTGWPFGGPWVDEKQACKYMTYKMYHLDSTQSLKDTIRYIQESFLRTANGKSLEVSVVNNPIAANTNLQALAIDQIRFPVDLNLISVIGFEQKGEVIDLSELVQNGILNWTAPYGHWDLYAVFHGLHGKMVERAAPGGEGNVIDHFDSNALKQYLSKFDQAFKGKDLSGLRCFFNDSYEVDDARGQSNWTPDFFDEFLSRRGYDLLKKLPSLFSKTENPRNLRILYDYRETISELVLEKFTKPWATWGHTKKKLIRNQSHGSPANILDLYAAIDIPETEGTDLTRFKFATSAAHVMGKPLASAEGATWLNEHFMSSLSDVKSLVDQYFLGGVNHIIYHGTNYSPQDATWPGWLFYAAVHFTPTNPFWKDFKFLNEYVTRCQSFLQQGKPDQQVLLYFPFADRNYQLGRDLLHHFDGMQGFENTVFKSSAEKMLEWGYQWDLISDKQIQSLKCVDGQLVAPGGKYQTLVLSGVQYLPLNSLKKIDTLVQQGATIIFHGNLPARTTGFSDYRNHQNQFDGIIQGMKLTPVSANSIRATYGAGKIFTGTDLNDVLKKAEIKNESGLFQLGLQTIKRRSKSGYYYFIKNSTPQKIEAWVPLSESAKQIILYDPMNNRSGLGEWKQDGSHSQVWLSLKPDESIIVETTNLSPKGKPYPYIKELNSQKQILDKGWQLKFLSGGPGLLSITKVENLKNWVDLPIPGIQSFSGTASYSIDFDLAGVIEKQYLLDLGEVDETAEIRLNGVYITTCIGPVYQALIPGSVLKSKNKLEIMVTNSMANRIIDMDKNHIPWKKFYNINMPARLVENKGSDGLFTAEGWKPRSSGLLGPVSLVGIKK